MFQKSSNPEEEQEESMESLAEEYQMLLDSHRFSADEKQEALSIGE